VKIAAASVFLWLSPVAFGQNLVPSQAAPAPKKAQEQASKSTGKIDPEKEAAIRKLFEIQGTRTAVEKVIAGMAENIKPMLSKMLPPGEYQDKLIALFFEKFQSKLKTDELLDLTVSVYDKYFSKEDIDGLAQFYQTPLGKKIMAVLPQVLIESQTAGMKMGEEIGRQSMVEVLAEHPDLAKALEDAGARKN
jgi:uncharacterized protein